MSRYRQKDEPTNTHCRLCLKDIWVPTGIHTIYHGKANLNTENNKAPESYWHKEHGSVCIECWEDKDE